MVYFSGKKCHNDLGFSSLAIKMVPMAIHWCQWQSIGSNGDERNGTSLVQYFHTRGLSVNNYVGNNIVRNTQARENYYISPEVFFVDSGSLKSHPFTPLCRSKCKAGGN